MNKVHEGATIISFTEWATEAEPRLRRALTAAFGSQIGQDATADALGVAWQKWTDIAVKDNPLGYVYGIGRNFARRMGRPSAVPLHEVPEQLLPDVEPGLPAAIANLSERQRVVVGLIYGFGWSLNEAAELLDLSKSTVQRHAERGLAQLRAALGVER